MLKILKDTGVNQVSKSGKTWGEGAQDHQDESAEKRNPTIQEESRSRDQADGNSPDSRFRFSTSQGDRRDRGITEAGSNSPDCPQTMEIHALQFVDTEVNISVNMPRQVPTERKSFEVARIQHSMMFKPVQFIDREGSSGTVQGGDTHPISCVTGSDDPEGAGKQVLDPKMTEVEAQLNRVRSSADTGSSQRRVDSGHRRVVKPRAERSTS